MDLLTLKISAPKADDLLEISRAIVNTKQKGIDAT